MTECKPAEGAEDGSQSAIMKAVDAYDAARLGAHNQEIKYGGMSETNKRSIAPMIKAAIDAYNAASDTTTPDLTALRLTIEGQSATLAASSAALAEATKERDAALSALKLMDDGMCADHNTREGRMLGRKALIACRAALNASAVTQKGDQK